MLEPEREIESLCDEPCRSERTESQRNEPIRQDAFREPVYAKTLRPVAQDRNPPCKPRHQQRFTGTERHPRDTKLRPCCRGNTDGQQRRHLGALRKTGTPAPAHLSSNRRIAVS